MSNLHKFQELASKERLSLLQAALILPATGLALRTVGVKRWQTLLTAIPRLKTEIDHRNISPDEQSKLLATKVARLVRAAANYGVYPANCLEQSLVLWYLLKRAGVSSEIRYGARKEQEQLHAHAWVECHGLTLNEDRGVEQRFAPFIKTRSSSGLASNVLPDL
jgi:Transglutaminase-like superfamily